ncbi:unnamed protein product [Caenorhabditis nigoni]
MQLFVKLNDHQEVAHNHFNLVLNEQSTLNQLEQEISSIWSIKRDYLDLYFADGRKISGFDLKSHLVQIGLKHLDKVIFKHSNLPNYVEMISYAEEARKAKSDGNVAGIISFVDAALPHLELLTSSNFFVIYPKFGPTLRAFRDDFDQYMNSDHKHIDFALEKYFSMTLGDNVECPTLIVNCQKKWRDKIRGGLIASVSRDGNVLGRYNVKRHIESAVYPYNQNADIREIFVYKLLELIKLGPKVHFVPNVQYLALGLFIVTEEVVGFYHVEQLDMTEDQLLQRKLIKRILELKELHPGNYGVGSDGNLIITDFRVGTSCGNASKYLNVEDRTERQRVARQCFESWQLESMIIKATDLIVHQKELFRKNGIQCKPRRDFELYLSEIRKNINDISSSL